VVPVVLRCLIVDDNPGFLQSARQLLEREGVSVVAVASNGEDALRRTEALRPEVVLVDVDLGDENGFDVVRSLHNLLGPAAPDLILISVHTAADLAELITASPAAGFITKSELSACSVRKLLDHVP
jgi:DNA-binding NarL/FixJ family response regulator